MTLTISAKFDATLLRPEGAERYLLFTIRAGSETDATRVPLNLSLILDRSGSMAGENKLGLVKEAAAFVVNRLTEQDRVSVIAYDNEVMTVSPSVQANAANRTRVAAAIAGIRTGGNTNLSEGWLTGCRQVAEFQSQTRAIDCAWLLTDGLANAGITDQEELTTHAIALRKRGISTTTFGVGLDFNEDLLQAMAEKGGGHFYFIDSSTQIKNYFAGELGERLHTVARNVTLQISAGEGIGIDNLNDYETTRSPGRSSFALDDMYAGEERQVVVKVTAPAGSIGSSLSLRALVTFTEAQSGGGREIGTGDALTLTYASAASCDAQIIDESVQSIAGTLLGAQAKRDILAANKRGDYTAAKARVGDFKRIVEQAVSPGAMQQALEEVENLGAAAAAPLPPAVAKSASYRRHLEQRSRQDYKKEEK